MNRDDLVGMLMVVGLCVLIGLVSGFTVFALTKVWP